MRTHTEAVSFTSGEETLRGRLFRPNGVSAGRLAPAAILLHGLGSGGSTMHSAARDLANLGVMALTFDQRGHGASTGVYAGDSSMDVRAAARFLAALDDVDASRIGIVSHSSGAREAILACARWEGFAALVCTSPAGVAVGGDARDEEAFYRRALSGGRASNSGGDGISVYPNDGALPWLNGLALRITSRAWSFARRYRLRVRWAETLRTWGAAQAGVAILDVPPRPSLFLHCAGDRTIPVMSSEILHQKISGRKELLIPPGGWHGAPLSRRSIRALWVHWLVETLSEAETDHGIAA